MSRRSSHEWAVPPPPVGFDIDVLVPTAGRTVELAATLAGLAGQDEPSFRVILSDQSDDGLAMQEPAIQSLLRVLRAQGRSTETHVHLPRRGLAEQRQFLLERSSAPFVLYLDDDVWLEPGAIARLYDAILTLKCGFVGAAVQGLSYLDDERPHQLVEFEQWEGDVVPETVRKGTGAFDRWPLHNAANLAHLARRLDLHENWIAYKVAWIGACALYNRAALIDSGGFDFWPDLPPAHAGEDVAAQWRVMERYGGAGILPSGAVHLEAPTTVPDRDVNAVDVVFAGE